MTTPNLGLETLPSNSLQPGATVNLNNLLIDALLHLSVEDKDLAAPPTTTGADVGKRWIVADSPTGAWAGQAGKIALCTAPGAWMFLQPNQGYRADVRDEGIAYRFDGTEWDPIAADVADGSIDGTKLSTTIRTLTASGTAELGDAYNVVLMNVATANDFTIPPNSSVAIPVGAFVEVWQRGAGQTTIVAGSGVTIHAHADLTLKLRGQHAGCSLRKVATNTWRLVGDMEPV